MKYKYQLILLGSIEDPIVKGIKSKALRIKLYLKLPI